MDASDTDDRSRALFAEGARLRALAGHLAADGGAADDLVQETWLAALRRAPSTDRPLAPWLGQVIRTLARRTRRGETRRADREREHADTRAVDVPSPAEIAERLDAQRTLVDLLAELDETLRTTLVLRYFDELTSVQIARAQGVPEGTVRWRIQRGLDELRERLDRRFGGSRGAWCALFLPLARSDAGALALASEGVVAMGAMAKIGVAIAVVAVAGVVWWASDSTPASAPSLASAPLIAQPAATESTSLADAASVQARERSAPVDVETRPAASPSADASSVPTAVAPVRASRQIVDARFVDANGAPWSDVKLSIVGEGGASADSGVDGRVALSFERPAVSLDSQHYEFVVTKTALTTRRIDATVRFGEPTHLGDIVLVPAPTLHGRVVGADGRPVAGARVGTTTTDLGDDDLENVHRRGSEPLFKSASIEVAADGHFDLAGVQPGTWRVWAGAERARFAWTEPLAVKEGDVFGIELVLEPLRPTDRIAGVVLDGKGKPVPNAALWIYYSTEQESGTLSNSADAEGRFDLVILRTTAHTIVASDPHHEWADSAIERIDPGALELVLRLGERRYVDVDVHNTAREPVAGCSFGVSREDPMIDVYTPVEAKTAGRYRVAVPSFACSVSVRADGYRTAVLGPYEAQRVPDHVDVVLEPVPIVRGRVIAGGKPVANARVALLSASNGRMRVNGFTSVMHRVPEVETRTDADGRFVLGCELTGELYVRATADGWVAADAGPFAAPRNETTVDLELTHGGAIEGRMLLADGKNAEGAIVGANHGDGYARTTRAGPGGAYRFDGLTPGKWQVVLSAEEVRPNSTMTRTVDEPSEIEWSCEVVAGRTTHHDVDAARQ